MAQKHDKSYKNFTIERQPKFGNKANLYQKYKLTEAQQIDENYNVLSWRKNYNYEQINLDALSGNQINQHPQFVELISIIRAYNREISKYEEDELKYQKIRNGPWRQEFIKRLFDLLHDVIFTSEKNLQEQLLDYVYNWAWDQLSKADGQTASTRPGSSTIRPQSGQLGQSFQQRPFSGLTYGQNQISQLQQQQNTAELIKKQIRPVSSIPATQQLQVQQRPFSALQTSIIKAQTRPFSAVQQQLPGKMGKQLAIGDQQKQVTFERPGSGLPQVNLSGDYEELIEHDEFSENEIAQYQTMSYQSKVKQPSEIIQELTKDYLNKARTMHTYCEPPIDRLKLYKRKLIIPEEQTKIEEFQEDETLKKQLAPGTDKILSSRNQLQDPALEKLKQEQIQQQPIGEEGEAKLEGECEGEEGEDEGEEGGVAEEEKQEPVQQEVQASIIKKAAKVTMKPPGKKKKKKKKKKKDKGPAPPNIPLYKMYIDDNTMNIKLRPDVQNHENFYQRSTYLMYQPTLDKDEFDLEKRWLYFRNQEVLEKKFNEEINQMMKQWSQAKGRLESEIDRKILSQKECSEFQKNYFKRKNIDLTKCIDFLGKKEVMKKIRENERLDSPSYITVKDDEIEDDDYDYIEYSEFDEEEGAENQQQKKQQDQNEQQQQDEKNQELQKGQENQEKAQQEDEQLQQKNKEKQEQAGGEALQALQSQEKQIDTIEVQDDSDDDSIDFYDFKGKNFVQRPFTAFSRKIKSANIKDLTSQPINQQVMQEEPKILQKYKFQNIENIMNKKKIDDIRKLHGEIINAQRKTKKNENDSDSEVEQYEGMPKTMSIYQQGRKKPLQRPFSAIISQMPKTQIQKEQIDEVQEIKNRLAKNKINIPLKSLMNALVIPKGLTDDKKLAKIPRSDFGLMKNPFPPKKKSKKKKKKKKKKA